MQSDRLVRHAGYIWQNSITEFQEDYKARQTSTSNVAQIPECIQKPDESINEYFA